MPPANRGLCGICFRAYSMALAEISEIAREMRDHLRGIGDEAGDAAADAYRRILREASKRTRTRSKH